MNLLYYHTMQCRIKAFIPNLRNPSNFAIFLKVFITTVISFMTKVLIFFMNTIAKPHVNRLRVDAGPAPRGCIPGPCSLKSLLVLPQMRNVPPKRGLCPKESNRLVSLENSSRGETPKILVINPEFVSKNQFFTASAVKTFFFFGLHPRNREQKPIIRRFCSEDLFFGSLLSNSGKQSFCVPQKLFMPPPPPPVTLLWRRAWVGGCAVEFFSRLILIKIMIGLSQFLF